MKNDVLFSFEIKYKGYGENSSYLTISENKKYKYRITPE